MTARSAAPRVALFLPPALLLHQAEEWIGGFPAWTATVLGDGVSPDRFVAINSAGLILITAGTLVARRGSGAAWLAVSFATLLAVNGLLHALATLAWGTYSPGTITGVLLSIPLGVVVMRQSADRIARPAFGGAIVFGLLIHAVVTLTALG